MNIIVCIKQVPDTNDIKIDPVKGTLIREGVPSIINPEDKNAIEAALRIKGDGKVVVLSMGPPQAEEALREALAMGADEAILLCDFKFAGSDTWATANVLAAAVKKIDHDLIICGRQAIDGDTAQVGPQLAENLGLPQVTYVQKISLEGSKLNLERAMEDGFEIIQAELPILITVVKEINEPRYITLQGIDKAYDTEIKKWTADYIGAEVEKIGIKGSPTAVKKTFVPPRKGQGQKIEGQPKEQARKIIQILKEKEIFQEF
ncbi:MAG: electron transfer flavoprotein subunit beta/FixA family protein [Nanoarchaeota archaeon]|nr:electron transfer flavoprotein subunit beta/FixA family protein [Nanoarchaeota archaeon]MBU1704845.1 electron transfer flavoprotein subunit beta/FixA family protein [Nanoarchaeota archaeon]